MIVLTGKELGDFPETHGGYQALRSKAETHFKEVLRDSVVYCPALEAEVSLRMRGGKHMLNVGATRHKLMLFPAILQMLQEAELVQHTKPTNKAINITDYYVLMCSVQLKGLAMTARLVVERDNLGRLLYDMAINKNALEVSTGVSKSNDLSTNPVQFQGERGL
jgi:Large polyvalent protein-associated domain 3